MKGGLSPALLDREESKGETPLDFKRGVTAREILTEMCERPLHTHGLPRTLRYTDTPSPLLTCSPMIKGKCTHTFLHLLPLPLCILSLLSLLTPHILLLLSLSLSLFIVHRHSMAPVVITVGHNFRDNLKTIYYLQSIRARID